MIKQWRFVIMAGLAVVLLGVALTLVYLFVPQVNENPEPDFVPSIEGTPIFMVSGSEVASIDFKSKEGEMTVLFDKNNTPYIKDASLPVSASALDTLVFNATQLYKIKDVIKDAPDLSVYGLKDPQATFTVTLKTGEKDTFDVGNMSPAENYYYGLDHRTNFVYTFSGSFERLGHVSFNKYVETNLSPQVDENAFSRIGMFRVKSPATNNQYVEIRRKTEEELAADTMKNSEYVFTKPAGVSEPSDGYLGLNVLPCFEQVKADQAVVLHPTQKQLVEHKVTKETAYYDLYFEVDGRGYQFYYSKPDDQGNMFLYTPSINAIYTTTEYNTTVLRSTIKDMQSTILFIEYIDNLKSITVESDGKTYEFGISGSSESETEPLAITYDGKSMNADEFGKLYQIMLNVTVEGQTAESPKADAKTIRITYAYRDDSKPPVTITYRDIDGRKYQIEYSGQKKFYTLEKQIGKLLTNLDNFINGKTVENLYSENEQSTPGAEIK